MVLVDFYQLAVLYKLAHGDGDSLSNIPPRSMPPPIPSYTRGMTPPADGTSLKYKFESESEQSKDRKSVV